MKNPLLSLALTLVVAVSAFGQTPPSAGFEAVSVKPSDPAIQGMRLGGSPNGDFNAQGATLSALIQIAYDLRDFEVSGGPGWIATERYDVIAKGAGIGVTAEKLSTMSENEITGVRAKVLQRLQMLLADRFQLKVHTETKELPVYALMIARSGPRIQAAPDGEKSGGSISTSRGERGSTTATAEQLSMVSLVKFLSSQVGRTVVDQTGLTGQYNFTLKYAPDMERAELNDPCSDSPSIFTALQEQLGLRLDSQKGPVEVLAIDSVQKPSEN